MLARETSTSACFLPVSLQFSSFKTLKGWRPPSSQSVCVCGMMGGRGGSYGPQRVKYSSNHSSTLS